MGRGTIEATDYRVLGTLYDYMRFDKVYAFGGMEFIMELDSYMTTLRAVTDCTLVKLPRPQFEKWMYADMQALRYEAKLVCEYLNKEARHNRVLLFLEGADRLALLPVRRRTGPCAPPPWRWGSPRWPYTQESPRCRSRRRNRPGRSRGSAHKAHGAHGRKKAGPHQRGRGHQPRLPARMLHAPDGPHHHRRICNFLYTSLICESPFYLNDIPLGSRWTF